MATMVRKPGPGPRALHSVSVGGQEFPIEGNYVHNVPDHLAKELEGHGFWTEDAALGYEVMLANKDKDLADQRKLDEEKEADERERNFRRMKNAEVDRLRALDEAKAEVEKDKRGGPQKSGNKGSEASA